MTGGPPEPIDAEVLALREEVARLRAEKGRVKALKGQLERSAAFLQEQRASFLKAQVTPSHPPPNAPRLVSSYPPIRFY